MHLIKRAVLFVLLATLSSANISHALTPPPPNEPKLIIHQDPAGKKDLQVIMLPEYDNKNNKYSFYSSDKSHRLALETTWPAEGKTVKYEFEKSKSYVCTGNALIVTAVFPENVIAIYPPPRINFTKLLVQLNDGICKWTDGMIHPAVFFAFKGLFEINKTGTEDPDLDLRLENAALKAEIEKLMSEKEAVLNENIKLNKLNSSLEFSIRGLKIDNESLRALTIELKNKNANLELLVSNVKKAFIKAKLSNHSSLRTLYLSLSKLFPDQVIIQAGLKSKNKKN